MTAKMKEMRNNREVEVKELLNQGYQKVRWK